MYTFNSTVFIIFTGNNIWLCTSNTGKLTSTTVWWRTKAIMFLDSKISVSWTICMREFLVLEGKFTLSMNEKRWNHVCVQQWEVDDMESLELNILDHLVLQVSIIVIHSLESTTLSSALLHIGNKPFPEARAHYCHKQARDSSR